MNSTQANCQAKSHYDIIVVGGGTSGISSAYHLVLGLKPNVNKSLAILEARSRLGGRLYSADHLLSTRRIELGAQWIHGKEKNPIYEIALANGLVNPLSYESQPPDDGTLNQKKYIISAKDQSGSKITDELIEETFQAFIMMFQQAESYFQSENSDQSAEQFDDSLGKYLLERIESYLKIKKDQLPPNSPHLKMVRGLLRTFLQLEASIIGSHSLLDVSLRGIGSYESLSGGNFILESSYVSILNVLLDAIHSRIASLNAKFTSVEPETTLGHNNNASAAGVSFDCLLEHQVTNVKWKNVTNNKCNISSRGEKCNCYVELTCANGSIIAADHVIVTLPLGVLKANHEKLFTPSLPECKVKSIQSLGFSVVDKIFLEFSAKISPEFFDASANEFMLIWTDGADDEAKDDESSVALKSHSPAKWWRTIYSFTRVSDYVLLGWLTGEEAKLVEQMNPSEVGRTITREVLRRFFHPNFPQPETTVVSNWAHDPFTKGSYSFVSTGSSVKDIEVLSKPIYSDSNHQKPILLFAGECTHPNFYSTVHGAFLTGKTAASYLLDSEVAQN